MNIRTIIFSTAILCIWLVSEQNHYEDTYVRETSEPTVFMQPIIVTPPPTIEDKIKEHFPRNGVTMVAVAKAESGMNMNAVGYNCYYSNGKATTTKIVGGSKACKVEDRKLAWSRDCGIMQLNTTKKSCPVETVDEHLKRAADLSRIQGLEAWVTYNEKLHTKHLAEK